jgi:hypothetical protein
MLLRSVERRAAKGTAEQLAASAEEVRAQYRAAELRRLYDRLSPQQQTVVDDLIKS